MKKLWIAIIIVVVVIFVVLIIINRIFDKFPEPGTVPDEAKAAGRPPESLPAADEDYFADMDYGATKNPEAMRVALEPYIHNISAADAVTAVAKGRNNWIVWTGGNDRLWDKLNANSIGNLDLLKTISNFTDPKKSPAYQATRDNRWEWYGLVNEPCYKKNTEPRADRFGLILDVRVEGGDCKPDPFENEQKYPGVKIGARGTGKLPVGSYYGYGTGIVGLRLFPNPKFDETAQAAWDPVRYYNDPTYYNSAKLVKPYRVGMSCGFCHVGPNPTNPPADPENPKWENLNSNPGAQYFWIDRIFMFDQDTSSFVWQLFHTSRPGALDTSLVSSDQINNPRTMNAIYNLKARLEIGKRWGTEQLAGGNADNKQFNDYVPKPLSPNTLLTELYDPATKTVRTTHVLKDGSDSVGALGALNRVYINIGLFSEEWLLHFIPLIGPIPRQSLIADIDPKLLTGAITIANCRKQSNYWNANEAQTPYVALFFLATAKPDYLAKAPGGAAHMTDAALIPQGKKVFAERCARCHSSKLPDKAFANFFKPGCIGPNYLQCWNDYWQWTKTDEFKIAMNQIVNAPDFLEDNFLSTEVRVPVTLLETNACSPLATNAIRDNIWDNFSSESYKNLPSVGEITVHNPFTYEPITPPYKMPAGGRGYTRPASLISLWSTAPFLQNNSVGKFRWTGTVDDRMKSFDDAIHQMLWPETRLSNPPGAMFKTKSGKMAPGWIDTTSQWSYLRIPGGYLPNSKLITSESPVLGLLFPKFVQNNQLVIGPIPKWTPVNLLSNLDLDNKFDQVKALLPTLKKDLKNANPNGSNEELRKAFANSGKGLLQCSKCPDFVVNRGHYFGTDYLPASEGELGLTDADKNALIAFLKTF